MNPKMRIAIVGIALLCVVGLIFALDNYNSSISTVPMPMPTADATSTPEPVRRTTPAEPLTKEQQVVLDELKNRHNCDPSCLATRAANDSYAEYGTPEQLLRPEWQALFPDTQFYIVPWVDHYMGVAEQKNTLFVSHEGQWYEAETYDLLLEANGIEVTDDNRELIAKAWALMTIPDYLGEEVTFTNWEQVSYTEEQARHPYNYSLQAWTRLGGWEVWWWFVFENTRIEVASGPTTGQSGTGEYIEQPFEDAHIDPSSYFYSSFQDYVFSRR